MSEGDRSRDQDRNRNRGAPEKRIPKSISADTTLLGSYSLGDFVVAALPGVAVILATQTLVPSGLTVHGIRASLLAIPLALVAIAGGVLFVSLTPAHVSSPEWLAAFVRFRRSERRLSHVDIKRETPIERIHPEHDAIERTDGAFVGAVQVSPPTMALATDGEWAAKTAAFEDFVNTTVEFPIQIYSTTRAFPTEKYLGHYEERRTDPDVRANDRLAALIDHYTDWYEQELAQRQMTIRDHYVLVPVRPEEARHDRESLLGKCAAIPVVGVLVDVWTAPSAAEERAAILAALADRRRRVDRGLRTIDGCGTSIVDATTLARVVAEYWTGTEFEYADPDRVIRTRPIVAGREVDP